MKRMMIDLFLGIIAAGVAHAVDTATTGTFGSTVPQPSTILICAAGMAFFRFVSKRAIRHTC